MHSKGITCTKSYIDIPWAHRQHNHDGHCAFIHGHNWGIIVTFQATELDENGFVVDFGKLKYLKAFIENKLDHALVLNYSDPQCLKISTFLQDRQAAKVLVVPDGSCEGMARYIYREFSKLVEQHEGGRVSIVGVTVTEDSKNSADYTPYE